MFLKAFSKPAKHYGFKIITLPEKYNRIMLIVVFSLFKAYYLEIQELDETCYCIYDFSKKTYQQLILMIGSVQDLHVRPLVPFPHL